MPFCTANVRHPRTMPILDFFGRLPALVYASCFLMPARRTQKRLDLVFPNVLRMRGTPDYVHVFAARRTGRAIIRAIIMLLIRHPTLRPDWS